MIYYDFLNNLIMSYCQNPTGFVHGFSKDHFCHLEIFNFNQILHRRRRYNGLLHWTLKFSWRHPGSRDNVLKGQFSKGNNSKSSWSIDFKFGVYLSWEKVYPKIARMWLWRHLMNIYEGMNFLEIRLHLRIFGKCSLYLLYLLGQ